MVKVSPWATLLIDGKRFGEVNGSRRIPLPVGPHHIHFAHPRRQKDQAFSIEDGRELTVAFNPEYLLDGLEVTPGDEVSIETVDALKDFTPIALLLYQGNGLVVNPSVPAKTTKELIALAKARPGQLNYGNAGTGSSQHMTAELFSKMAGVKMTGVAYKGGAPALIDLIGASR